MLTCTSLINNSCPCVWLLARQRPHHDQSKLVSCIAANVHMLSCMFALLVLHVLACHTVLRLLARLNTSTSLG